MIVFADYGSPKLIQMMKDGAVGALLTDTLYGLVAKADNSKAVERVYAIKARDESKSPIVLISDVSQLYDPLPRGVDQTIDGKWPGKNSVILPAPSAPDWIRRGNSGVAYRMPDNAMLRRLLDQTGALIAPSANPQGKTPARSIGEAEGYFGDSIDFYVDGGVAFNDQPSRLFSLTDDGSFEQLR